MRILVVGGGGREHAIIKKLKKNPEVTHIVAMPGNAGISADAECVNIKATDIDGIVDYVKAHPVDFAVVAPDDPLALGCVDRLHALGVKCFGPDAKAARIEASKVFAKDLMKKYGIPTAAYETFEDAQKALDYVKDCPLPIVVKADGLALGKGVTICFARDEAANAVKAAMLEGAFGASGSRVVIEEYLEGPEVSVLAFTDGHVVKPMVSSMDHKRVGDGDVGPNTGGMGTIAPNPCYTPDVAERCIREIFLPTIAAMNAEGCPFKGCLYFGLMVTKDGPKVIEYNCRFGDPETQVVLPLMKSDLLTAMLAVENETLADIPVEFADGAACCVMLASGGYPGKYEKGKVIDLGKAEDMAEIFHSGTGRNEEGALITSGGRVLGVCCTAEDLRTAIGKAYRAADQIKWDGMICRRDIGKRALEILNDKF